MGQCCPKNYVAFEEDDKGTSHGEEKPGDTELSTLPVPLISHVVVANAEAKTSADAPTPEKSPKPAPPKGPTPEELARLAARHDLEAVAARFELPTFDVTEDPNRVLLKIGTLTRQARFKTVKRVCILCNDVFIFANLMDNDEFGGKLEMKQVIELSTATLDDRTGGKTRMKNAVCINSPTRNFIVSASCAAEREEWMKLLAQQIVRCQGLPRILQHLGDEEEDAPAPPPSASATKNEKKEDVAAASLHTVLRGTLHSFALMGELDNMKLLIQQKKTLDINALDSEGSTALHVAVQANSLKACEILLEAKADATISTRSGQNTLHLACVKGNVDITKLILNDGKCTAVGVDKEGNSPLFLVATRCEKPQKIPPIIDLLVGAGADVKAKSYPEGRTLLHVVAERGLAAAVAPLVSHGASLSAVCNAGRTPLHYASAADCMDTCVAIIGQGAFPNRRDRQGNTPLHLAPSLQMANYLVSVGAQPELTNTAEVSALQRFQDHKDPNVLATLQRCVAMHHNSPPVVLTEALPAITEGNKVAGCLLCQSMFNNITNLRHYCRRCGAQVCGKCSSKKVSMNTGGPPPPPARQAIDAMANIAKMAQLPTLGLLSTELRVCDGCYNYLRFKKSTAPAVVQEEEEPEEAPAQRQKEAKPRTWQDDVNDTLSLSQQNKQILEQNILKLGEMEDKAQNLQDSGKEFFDAAQAIAAKAKAGKL